MAQLIPIPDPSLGYLKDIGDNKLYFYKHTVPIGIFYPGSKCLGLIGAVFNQINPTGLEVLYQLKVGDYLDVTVQKDENWKNWNPSVYFDLPDDYSEILRIKLILKDTFGYPIAIASKTI